MGYFTYFAVPVSTEKTCVIIEKKPHQFAKCLASDTFWAEKYASFAEHALLAPRI